MPLPLLVGVEDKVIGKSLGVVLAPVCVEDVILEANGHAPVGGEGFARGLGHNDAHGVGGINAQTLALALDVAAVAIPEDRRPLRRPASIGGRRYSEPGCSIGSNRCRCRRWCRCR